MTDIKVEDLVGGQDGLVIRCLRNIGPYENNIFLVSDEGSGEAYVLDAGFEPQQIAQAASGLHVKAILVTHGHRDHHENVGTLKGLLKARGVEFSEINLSKDPDGRAALARETGMLSFPQVIVDGVLVGGFTEVQAAAESGRLDEMLAA